LVTFRPGGALANTVSPAVARHTLQTFDTHLDWLAPGLLRTIGKLAPDVVLCMGRMANCHAGFIARKFPKMSVVCTMRTGKNLPWLFRQGLRYATHTVANSNAAAEILAKKYAVAANRISVIYNAPVFEPEEEISPTLPTQKTPNSPVVSAPKTILCCAMFRPEKGQRTLLEAAAKLPRERDWKLVFAGTGPTLPACRQLAQKLAISDRVSFLGFIADPRPLYRTATVAALASSSESLSNFLIEAHLHAVPSVAFEAGGVAECGGTIVSQGDTEKLTEKLSTLLFDDFARAAEATRVQQIAQANFTQNAQRTAYLILFSRLTEKPLRGFKSSDWTFSITRPFSMETHET
jgi:glycosyltransferase involved in cell wall biosynthesis